MNLSDRTLCLYIDDDQMATVFLESLLGDSFEILSVGKDAELTLPEGGSLDWMIVDFDLPDTGAAEFIQSSGNLRKTHGYAMLSGATVGVVAWEKLHGLESMGLIQKTWNVQTFLSLIPSAAASGKNPKP